MTITHLKTNIRATCHKNLGTVVPIVQELWPVEVEKKVIFRVFSFWSLPGSPGRDPKGYSCHLGIANAKTNVRAISGQKMSTIVSVVQELRPIEVKKRTFFCLFSILHQIGQTFGIFFGNQEVVNLKTKFRATSGQKMIIVVPVVQEIQHVAVKKW